MNAPIERARHSDFLNIAALDRIAWLHTGEQYIADGEHVWRVWCEYATVLIARSVGSPLADSADIAGAVVMFPTRQGELFLHKIMVHPTLRGHGLGSGLMRAALAEARSAVLLTVDPSNAAAIQLYRNFGFEVRELVQGYYRPHEDRCLMVFVPALSKLAERDA